MGVQDGRHRFVRKQRVAGVPHAKAEVTRMAPGFHVEARRHIH